MAGFIRFAVLLDFAPEGWARSKVKRVDQYISALFLREKI